MGEVAKYRNGKAHENCIDESGKYIVVNSKFVSTNGTVIKHSNMQNEPLAQNEIAFVLSDVPNGRAIARTFLVEENDKYTLNQRIAGITSSENTYPYFLHILMNRHPYFLAFDDGVKQTNLSVSDVLNFETYYPEYEEQKQIGEYFRNLDRLITLHQREFAFLCKEKSKKFRYIKNAWEQRKLGELVDRVVRKNINNESTLPLTISAQYGLVDQITYFNNRVASRDVSNYYLVLNGEFAYNKSTSDGYPFGAVKRLDLYEKGVLSTLYIVFAPKKEQQIDSDYLTVFFDTDRWHKGVAERAAEGARNHGLLNISAEDFFDIDLSVPKDIVEQKQIGAFIRQLDDLITLHQRKPNFYTGGYYAE